MQLVLVSLFLSPAAAFVAGAVARRPWRVPIFLVLLLAPLMLYTLDLTSRAGSPLESGFWQWWVAGLLMLAGPLLLSAGAALLLFYIGGLVARRVRRR